MSKNIDLKELTQLELLELRSKLNDELADYGNREKKKAYCINERGVSTRYFSKKNKAHAAVIDLIDDDGLFTNTDVECSIVYVTTEEWKEICEDLD